MNEANTIEANSLKRRISHQYHAFQELPVRTKTIATIIGSLILALIITVLISSEDTNNTDPQSADKGSSSNKDIKFKQNESPLKIGTMLDIETTAEPLISEREIEKIKTIKKISEQNTKQLASISSQLGELKAQLNPIPEEYQQHGVEIQNIHSQLASLEIAQQKLQAALTTKVSRLKRKRRVRSRPSFKLVSIDLWGNDESIIIRQNNQLHDLSLGQSFGKWKVESIDIKSSKVIFSNQRGVNRTLFIES